MYSWREDVVEHIDWSKIFEAFPHYGASSYGKIILDVSLGHKYGIQANGKL